MTESVSRPASATGGSASVDASQLGAVTVTYNPDLEILERQLSRLPANTVKVVVDNASRDDQQEAFDKVIARSGAVLLRNDRNEGLPAALNRGCRYLRQSFPDRRYVLLLDQDSEPDGDGVEELLTTCAAIEAREGRPSCVGPRLLDVTTGLEHGFHQIKGWRWVRTQPLPLSREPVPLANLNGSGTLMPLSIFDELGGLENALFIDHVDTEWAFRVLAKGYGLYGVPGVTFRHRMGERSLRFWCFGWRIWPYRSPMRHFYLFRNAAWLLRRDYVPTVWKFWAVVKLLLTLVVHGLFDPARKDQLAYMLRGLRATGGDADGPKAPHSMK